MRKRPPLRGTVVPRTGNRIGSLPEVRRAGTAGWSYCAHTVELLYLEITLGTAYSAVGDGVRRWDWSLEPPPKADDS
jgi:hypothetical protein